MRGDIVVHLVGLSLGRLFCWESIGFVMLWRRWNWFNRAFTYQSLGKGVILIGRFVIWLSSRVRRFFSEFHLWRAWWGLGGRASLFLNIFFLLRYYRGLVRLLTNLICHTACQEFNMCSMYPCLWSIIKINHMWIGLVQLDENFAYE